MELRTRYILEPGARHVRIESTLENISANTLDFPNQTVLKALSGPLGLNLEGFTVPTGHVLGFGKLNNIFLPEAGYDVQFGLQEAYEQEGTSLPAFPGMLVPYVASTNSRGINYGFAAEPGTGGGYPFRKGQQQDASGQGLCCAETDADEKCLRRVACYSGRATEEDMLFLFNASGFSAVLTHELPASLAPGQAWTFTNYLILGDGDASSIVDELHQIRGRKAVRVRAQVFDGFSGQPVDAGESVLFYRVRGGADPAVACARAAGNSRAGRRRALQPSFHQLQRPLRARPATGPLLPPGQHRWAAAGCAHALRGPS